MSIARDYKSDKVNFETRFRRDFPGAGDDETRLIRAVASACLMLQRALSADCVEAAMRADRRLRKAIQALRAEEQDSSERGRLTPAEWAADLLWRYRNA